MPSNASRPIQLAIALIALAGASAVARPADPFETAGTVPASRYLAANEMAGPDWSVAPDATSDGFGLTFSVVSRFGTWPARGRLQLGIRAREVQALAELDRISKSEVFVDAVKRSAVGQVETIASFATQPVETVKAIPGGVKRLFQKTTYQVKETYHDVKTRDEKTNEDSESAGDKGDKSDKAKQVAQKEALDYLNISSAERRWYAQLGVDPYGDNQVLRKAIKSYARVEGLTSFGMKFVGLPSIPGVSQIRRTMDLVWKTDPWELRRRNRKALLAAGIDEETARRFEDNPALSLTMQTAVVDSLEALSGVAGREHLLARAVDVASRGEGQTLVTSTALLLRYHRAHEPLAAFLPGSRVPVARTQAGALVAVLATDALSWTEEVAGAAATFASAYEGEKASARVLWVVGDASPRFKAEAQKLGWEVRDHWQLSTPEDAAAASATGER